MDDRKRISANRITTGTIGSTSITSSRIQTPRKRSGPMDWIVATIGTVALLLVASIIFGILALISVEVWQSVLSTI